MGEVVLNPRRLHFHRKFAALERALDCGGDRITVTKVGEQQKFLALDTAGQAALASDMRDLIARFNTATDGTMRVPSDYAEVIVTKV